MIRPATLDDVAAVAELERELFGVDAWSTDQVIQELEGAGREVLVDANTGGLSGYLVTLLVDDVLDLLRIGVRPELRRAGVATALLGTALARPAARVLLEVADTNQAALAFYTGAGFVEIARRRRYYRDGSDALVLERVHDRDHDRSHDRSHDRDQGQP